MTLENLIRIVSEVVEEIMKRERLHSRAFAFDHKNIEKLKEYMKQINDSGEMITNTFLSEKPDLFFVDYIPIQYLPKVALGICDSEFTTFFNQVLWSGKKIAVLYQYQEPFENKAMKPLFDSYIKMLESYGVLFFEQPQSNKKVFTANVMSKQDLYAYAKDSDLFVTPQVVITDLAKEEAKRLNINIIRLV